MTDVRRAAVAGTFYPGQAGELQMLLHHELAEAERRMASRPVPKAIIAPHAGYIYSGPIAASAYARLAPASEIVRRVVLIGPSHRVLLRGLAVPSVEAFETPLGRVPLDRAAIADILTLPHVREWDAPHAEEHSLEVHLPFLQAIFPNFSLVPVVIGDATGDAVADVLERLWDGPETRIVASSDLSHYLNYADAQRLDAATCRAIEALDADAIGYEQACGRVPVAGLLAVARRKRLVATTLDLRNSGDTAGDRRRVVGYGAWMFTESGTGALGNAENGASSESDVAAATSRLLDRHGATLLHLCAASIEHGLRYGQALPVVAADYAEDLRTPGATFVTLSAAGRLRGCIGSVEAWRPLVEDVSSNGFAAAFRDERFPAVDHAERDTLSISVSLLGQRQPLHFADEAELLAQLCVGTDGVIIRSDGRSALFLPQVWRSLPEPGEFLGQLKVKAGLGWHYWSSDLQAWRFGVESISSEMLPAGALWS